jgi:hypothetical protein
MRKIELKNEIFIINVIKHYIDLYINGAIF